MLFPVFTWTTTAARQKKTKHGNENLQRASWYLLQIKKAYINTVCTKSATKDSPNCFAIFC